MREPHLHDYLDERCGPIPAYLHAVERRTHLRTMYPQMLTGHMQGRFLSWLVSWLRAGVRGRPFRVLEVGTFTGYSALCFAERLTAGDVVHTIEVDDERETMIREHIGMARLACPIEVHIGDANEVAPALPGAWDIIYLDARKADYPRQFEALAPRLAVGGVLLLDNVLWDGAVVDATRGTAAVLRAWSLGVSRDARWETLTLPMRDGLMAVRAAGPAASAHLHEEGADAGGFGPPVGRRAH